MHLCYLNESSDLSFQSIQVTCDDIKKRSHEKVSRLWLLGPAISVRTHSDPLPTPLACPIIPRSPTSHATNRALISQCRGSGNEANSNTAVCTKHAKRSAIEREGNGNLRFIKPLSRRCSAPLCRPRSGPLQRANLVGQLLFPAATAPLTLFATLALLDRSFIYLTFPPFQFFLPPRLAFSPSPQT